MRHICTLVMRMLAGLNVDLMTFSTDSVYNCESALSLDSATTADVSMLLMLNEIGCVAPSRRNVAAASRNKKLMCDSVCVMNLDAGQRSANATLTTR